MNKIASRLTQRRLELGLRQKQVAQSIGMTQPHLSLIESGEANPNINTIIRLASALDIKVSDLTEGL
jgi:XRE family transcriptional regulator, regulator of sulfur utilization